MRCDTSSWRRACVLYRKQFPFSKTQKSHRARHALMAAVTAAPRRPRRPCVHVCGCNAGTRSHANRNSNIPPARCLYTCGTHACTRTCCNTKCDVCVRFVGSSAALMMPLPLMVFVRYFPRLCKRTTPAAHVQPRGNVWRCAHASILNIYCVCSSASALFLHARVAPAI